jgi:glycogen synthase
VLVNQFGWGRDRCGMRMPKAMESVDIRQGTDLEFGQSIYEPFGIGQLEPLAMGALCCVSNVCGCVEFIKQANGSNAANVLVSDYITLPAKWDPIDFHALMNIGQSQRDEIEMQRAVHIAQRIVRRLPRTSQAKTQLLEQGQALSQQMAWRVVVEQGLLPALKKLF